MNKNDKLIYLVEGENEKLMVNTLKNVYLYSGKVHVFNVVNKKISDSRIRTFGSDVNVILVFDTDLNERSKVNILKSNLEKLQKSKHVKRIIIVTQVKNFEDELIRACSISKIIEFTNSKTKKDFKRDFNKLGSSLENKLIQHKFDINKFWIKEAEGLYKEFKNRAEEIKIR